jgi:transposase
MLQITPHHTILLAVQPVDFRKGIDGLAALCRSRLIQDPFSGKVFVFTNKQKKCVKILVYDGQGFWLCTRRFSKGRLAWWPSTKDTPSNAVSHEVLASQLQVLLYQGSVHGANIPPAWRQLKRPEAAPVPGSPLPSFRDNSREASLQGTAQAGSCSFAGQQDMQADCPYSQNTYESGS